MDQKTVAKLELKFEEAVINQGIEEWFSHRTLPIENAVLAQPRANVRIAGKA